MSVSHLRGSIMVGSCVRKGPSENTYDQGYPPSRCCLGFQNYSSGSRKATVSDWGAVGPCLGKRRSLIMFLMTVFFQFGEICTERSLMPRVWGSRISIYLSILRCLRSQPPCTSCLGLLITLCSGNHMKWGNQTSSGWFTMSWLKGGGDARNFRLMEKCLGTASSASSILITEVLCGS